MIKKSLQFTIILGLVMCGYSYNVHAKFCNCRTKEWCATKWGGNWRMLAQCINTVGVCNSNCVLKSCPSTEFILNWAKKYDKPIKSGHTIVTFDKYNWKIRVNPSNDWKEKATILAQAQCEGRLQKESNLGWPDISCIYTFNTQSKCKYHTDTPASLTITLTYDGQKK